MLLTYFILPLQDLLPFQSLFNPQKLPGVNPHLAFNTAASFTPTPTGSSTAANRLCRISRRWSA